MTLCNAQCWLLHKWDSFFTMHEMFYTATAEKVTLYSAINMKKISLGESSKIKLHELKQPFRKSHLQIEVVTYLADTQPLDLLASYCKSRLELKEEQAVYKIHQCYGRRCFTSPQKTVSSCMSYCIILLYLIWYCHWVFQSKEYL